MQSITVDKEKLIETIKRNRDSHRDQFLVAQERFREEVIRLLDERLAAARDGKKVDLAIRLPEPEDFTSYYDTALNMLEWEEADEVELDQTDFERYVENKWEWAGRWAGTTANYL
jgi:hypothetical protein